MKKINNGNQGLKKQYIKNQPLRQKDTKVSLRKMMHLFFHISVN